MINDSAFNSLAGLVTNKTELSQGLPIMEGTTLKVCTFVPYNMQTSGCTVIWDAATSNASQLLGNFTSTAQPATSITTPVQTSSATQSTTTQSTTTVSDVTFTTLQTSSAVKSKTQSSITSDHKSTIGPTVSTIGPTVSTTHTVVPSAPTATSFKSGTAQNTTTFHAQSTTSSAALSTSTHSATSSVLHGNATIPTNSANSTGLPIRSRRIATDLRQELRARSNIDSTCQASLAWPISVYGHIAFTTEC